MIIKAPFTTKQVLELIKFQANDNFHPFTCRNRGDGNHPEIDGEHGVLVPTTSGWICQFCDYKQDWCHEIMAVPRGA